MNTVLTFLKDLVQVAFEALTPYCRGDRDFCLMLTAVLLFTCTSVLVWFLFVSFPKAVSKLMDNLQKEAERKQRMNVVKARTDARRKAEAEHPEFSEVEEEDFVA